MKLIVPMYGYPTVATALWAGVAEAGPLATAIINPASGPTATPNSDYVRACNSLKTAGVQMVGYIDANYCQRPVAQVLADIGTWRTGWGTWLSGVFVDRMSANVAYLSSIQRATLAYGWKMVVNPGVVWAPGISSYCDVVVIFENSRAVWENTTLPTHAAGEAAIIHSSPTLGNVVDDARRAGLSMVYVTNDGGANPYDTLPVYWSELVAAVRGGVVQPPAPTVEERLTRIEATLTAMAQTWAVG